MQAIYEIVIHPKNLTNKMFLRKNEDHLGSRNLSAEARKCMPIR